MAMVSLNITLPQALKDYVENQVASGAYSTPSEYVRDLLQQDQKERENNRLEDFLLEGLKSGEPLEANEEYWEGKRLQLIGRHSRKSD